MKDGHAGTTTYSLKVKAGEWHSLSLDETISKMRKLCDAGYPILDVNIEVTVSQ